MPDQLAEIPRLDPQKFQDPDITADGERRAVVALTRLHTLWFNTGTLCNIACVNCYIESSPKNDRLSYLTLGDVTSYLNEIAALELPVEEIGFTGGEPFMNPDFLAMVEACLARGFRVLILTNAMKPMQLKKQSLDNLRKKHGKGLSLRVSVDHYTQRRHEELRGQGSWSAMLDGLVWLAQKGFDLAVAGRTRWGESEFEVRQKYAELFDSLGIAVKSRDPASLVLFPEMDERLDVAEITTSCWGLLSVSPDQMMCATSRMIVKRKGEVRPVVVPCTLLPYDRRFELGHDLAQSSDPIKLNHPHCARFCVLGGGACA